MHFEQTLLKQCWFLAGPTACGKSAMALELAQRLNAEIVALDSMSLYRHLDIGTAKPTTAERAIVPHHLIDIIDPHEEYTVAEYVRAAEVACRSIVDRDRVPLFVGGTGLYLRSILRGVCESPAADWTFRSELAERAKGEPPDWLLQQLAKVDPVSASRLHAADTRRIIRALEVYRLTGQSASSQKQQSPLPEELRPPHVYWLHPPRDWLYERINRRVDQMFNEGLLEEVRGCMNRHPPLSRTAQQGLGYKEVISHLRGDCSLQQAIELTKTKTRQFAKRQHTWFRNLEECSEVIIDGTESIPELTAHILEQSRDL
ncbi:MAG: tRNA (adenosine(37)-N6)-dimethylallyltransferase MiaA [Planctomycetaceae bacterium]